MPGSELSVDGLLNETGLTVTAIFDKPDTGDGPTFEETLLISPPRLPEPLLSKAVSVAKQAARALGLEQGPIHAELRLDTRDGEAKPTMLEPAARSIGGLCSRALHFLDGVSLEAMVLAQALGRPVSPRRVSGVAGVLMIPVEHAGVLGTVDGKVQAVFVPGITGLSITTSVASTFNLCPRVTAIWASCSPKARARTKSPPHCALPVDGYGSISGDDRRTYLAAITAGRPSGQGVANHAR